MADKKHVEGIFMGIKIKAHKPDVPESKTRIYVMEIPSGKLYAGLLATSIVLSLRPQDAISEELDDIEKAEPKEVFREEKKPAEYIFIRFKTGEYKAGSLGNGKVRIYVMEISTGKLYQGLLDSITVRGFKLRDTVSKKIAEMEPAAIEEVFDPKDFDTEPGDYFAKQDLEAFR
jgi:hypothetical protein